MNTKRKCRPAGKWVRWGTCMVTQLNLTDITQRKEAKDTSVYAEPQPGKMPCEARERWMPVWRW